VPKEVTCNRAGATTLARYRLEDYRLLVDDKEWPIACRTCGLGYADPRLAPLDGRVRSDLLDSAAEQFRHVAATQAV
jgi:hypothetical protein